MKKIPFEVVFLISVFLSLGMVAVVVLVFSMKDFINKREAYYKQQLEQTRKELADIKALIVGEVSDVFKELKNFINKSDN